MDGYKRFAAICCLMAILTFKDADAAITTFTQVVAAGGGVTETVTMAIDTSTATTTLTLAEDFNVANAITTFTATDATGNLAWKSSDAAFTITLDWAVTVSALDYETAPSLTTTLTATDTDTGTIALTVTVTDVNDVEPTFTPLSYAETVTDASAAGTTVATVTASDGDGSTFNTITYEISAGNTDAVFEATSGGDIKIATGMTVDRATLKGYALTVLAKDAGTAGDNQQTGTATVIIGVCPSTAAAVVASVAVILLTTGITILS